MRARQARAQQARARQDQARRPGTRQLQEGRPAGPQQDAAWETRPQRVRPQQVRPRSRRRHARSRDPRAHWLLLLVTLPVMFVALFFEGWTSHQVDAATTRPACTRPVPKAVAQGGPVVRIDGNRTRSFAMPAHTVALTYDGGPDPVWTPRLLKLLRQHHAHATFFVNGAQAARYPGLMREIRDAGHEIGSNTYTGADMGAASRLRAPAELALARSAIAGTAGVRTKLLRMPQTTTVNTVCDAEWSAARRAADDGYVLVAADRPKRKPSLGAIRQYGQTSMAYAETRKLLDKGGTNAFTTVSAGLGQASTNTRANGPADASAGASAQASTNVPASATTQASSNAPASTIDRWTGTALVWATAAGRALVEVMGWVLAVAGALGVLRLLMLVVFARAHVRRLTRFRPGSPWLRGVNEPVTVLIPAHNEAAGIEATVHSLLASTHPYLQIIVIDDGSTDETADLATWIDDPRVMVIRQPNSGKSTALNTGLAHARHDIIVMIDGDTVVEKDAIQQLIQPLAHPAVGAVSGNTKVGNRRGLLGRWQHLEYVSGFNLDRRMFEVLECMPTVPGAIGAFRRDALMGVGGISADTLAEDTDLTMALWRAGWRVVYEETAVAWTEVPSSLRQLWRQRYRWCYGTLQAVWKHRRAVLEVGPAGRFGRRGLSYLLLFQVALPLLAPVVDLYAVYGALFANPWGSVGVWLAFLVVQLICAGYALRLDGERVRTLWSMPFQFLVYRQLMYLVIIQSVVALLLGTRLRWHRMQRSGTAIPTHRRAEYTPSRP